MAPMSLLPTQLTPSPLNAAAVNGRYTCPAGRLLVIAAQVSLPGTDVPSCLWSAVSHANLSKLPPACGLASNGEAMRIAPCNANNTACSDYGKKFASSWFTPHVYRLPDYATTMPLQRTWLLARLTAVDETGEAAEPCVTHRSDASDIGAMLFIPPPTMLRSPGNYSTKSVVCAGYNPASISTVMSRLDACVSAAAIKLPRERRFVVSMDKVAEEQADSGFLALPRVIREGTLQATFPHILKFLSTVPATFVNRGGAILVKNDTIGIPEGGFPLASPQFGTTTNMIAGATLNSFMGWATNIDSAYTPVSAEDMRGWQTVLRRRATYPEGLAKQVAKLFKTSEYGSLKTLLGAAELREKSGLQWVHSLVRLIGTDGGPHGCAPCIELTVFCICICMLVRICMAMRLAMCIASYVLLPNGVPLAVMCGRLGVPSREAGIGL
eukprot:6983406-Prymnesium_polylepis.2